MLQGGAGGRGGGTWGFIPFYGGRCRGLVTVQRRATLFAKCCTTHVGIAPATLFRGSFHHETHNGTRRKESGARIGRRFVSSVVPAVGPLRGRRTPGQLEPGFGVYLSHRRHPCGWAVL